MRNILFFAAVGLLLLSRLSHGVTITFQDGVNGYSGTEDTILFSGAPATNYGANGFLQVGALQNNGVARSLIRFDLASLAGQYSSIDSITLKLTIQGGFTNTVQLFEPVPENANWIGGTAPNGVQADTSTWGKLSQTTIASGIDWEGGPGLGTTGYGPLLASATFMAGQVGALDFVISDSAIATALVDGFTDGSNPGFFLVATNESITSDSSVLFLSSDTGTASFRPLIVVDYTPIPEPTTAMTLVFGLGGLATRRRSPSRQAREAGVARREREAEIAASFPVSRSRGGNGKRDGNGRETGLETSGFCSVRVETRRKRARPQIGNESFIFRPSRFHR